MWSQKPCKKHVPHKTKGDLPSIIKREGNTKVIEVTEKHSQIEDDKEVMPWFKFQVFDVHNYMDKDNMIHNQ